MRVLLLSDLRSPHTRKWVRGLLSKGIETGVFSLNAPFNAGEWHMDHLQLSFPGRQLADPQGAGISKVAYLAALPRLKRFIKGFRPDIIHAHYASSFGLLGALSRFHPYVITAWGSDIDEFPLLSALNRHVLKYNLWHAERITAASPFLASQTSMYTSNSVDVIPFGIDTGMFFPAKGAKLHTDRPLTFGIVKTMEHIYGIDTSVRGFHRLLALHPGLSAKLVIAGGGTQTDSYRKLAVELGIGDRVEFRGRIPYEDVPAFLQQTDIFLNMSRMESFGVSVLEASACGIPVVASKTGGLKGVVIEGETGFLVDPDDTETLADRMWRLADDPSLRSSFGNRGKEMVHNQFNFTKNLEEMITLYRQVMKESR